MSLCLVLLPDDYAVAQFPATAQLPEADGAAFWSLTRTATEASLVCKASRVPPGAVKTEPGWRVLALQGPFDFALTGILAGVAVPLAQAGVGIFAVSTFDTDYVLVKALQLEAALAALRAAGHVVQA